MIVSNGVVLLTDFLDVSQEELRRRFQRRIEATASTHGQSREPAVADRLVRPGGAEA